MKKIYFSLTLLLTATLLRAQSISDLSFGTDSTFDVMTWNIEHFPKNGTTTINYVADIIEALDVDVIAIQEIDVPADFGQLLLALDGYTGVFQDNEYARLGYLYKSDLEVVNISQLFTGFQYHNIFPRPPLVMDLNFMGDNFVLVNNHLKCCGDGVLDTGDTSDEENRRRLAVNTLHSYMTATWPDRNIMLMGDLNDILTETNPANNVFATWMDDSTNFKFADMAIAEGPSSDWSYPSWPSHLDHILISNELYDELDAPGSVVECIRVDDYFPGGFSGYDYNVSDHRPVGFRFVPASPVGVADNFTGKTKVAAFPNPAEDICTLRYSGFKDAGRVDIYSIFGQVVSSIPLTPGASEIRLDVSQLANGVYLAIFRSTSGQEKAVKLQILH